MCGQYSAHVSCELRIDIQDAPRARGTDCDRVRSLSRLATPHVHPDPAGKTEDGRFSGALVICMTHKKTQSMRQLAAQMQES